MCSRGPGRGEPWTGARAGGERGVAVLRLLCAPAARHAANPACQTGSKWALPTELDSLQEACTFAALLEPERWEVIDSISLLGRALVNGSSQLAAAAASVSCPLAARVSCPLAARRDAHHMRAHAHARRPRHRRLCIPAPVAVAAVEEKQLRADAAAGPHLPQLAIAGPQRHPKVGGVGPAKVLSAHVQRLV